MCESGHRSRAKLTELNSVYRSIGPIPFGRETTCKQVDAEYNHLALSTSTPIGRAMRNPTPEDTQRHLLSPYVHLSRPPGTDRHPGPLDESRSPSDPKSRGRRRIQGT
jgi:hypothetical protein